MDFLERAVIRQNLDLFSHRLGLGIKVFRHRIRKARIGDPVQAVRLRGQMLRRVQLVVGDGRVNDLLIMEFVLN